MVSVIQPDDETISIRALSCCVNSAFWVTPTSVYERAASSSSLEQADGCDCLCQLCSGGKGKAGVCRANSDHVMNFCWNTHSMPSPTHIYSLLFTRIMQRHVQQRCKTKTSLCSVVDHFTRTWWSSQSDATHAVTLLYLQSTTFFIVLMDFEFDTQNV